MTFKAAKFPLGNRGSIPDSFLYEIVEFGRVMPDACYMPNDSQGDKDVFNLVRWKLSPWISNDYRRAVMCEVLRVIAGWESSWNWKQGVDTTNSASLKHITQQETGAFQVSFDSVAFDDSLKECVNKYCGNIDAESFIKGMKENHNFAMGYCALLLRHNTRWSGPCNTGDLVMSVRRDSVSEFLTALQESQVLRRKI